MPRKPYSKPIMISEDLFESKALACVKTPTGGPDDCNLSSFGIDPNSTS